MMMMTMTRREKKGRNCLQPKKLIGTLSPSINRVNRPFLLLLFFFFWFPFVERTFSHRIQNGVSMLLFIFLFNNKKREKRVNMSCPSNKTATSRA
jgi:hypothetical protein